ncbi:hypothetical protein J1605_004011 [Eschrichtius robustus]|uniref:Uncharacterized protein n=1 Tax=Eschrichtius robustus TaxID=9764 RepID=A0AB34HMB2_ESCRO|nr:hypothetical protein J1605_004011 [Eschrichtius robustus]
MDKLGLYPRARVSRFRLPPGGHHRGDRAAPYGRGASPRERHGGAPQPPAAAAAASSRQRPGLGGGEEGASEHEVGGAGLPQIQGERLLRDLAAWPSFLAPGAFYSGGPALLQPQARLHATPHAAAAATAALPAPEAAQCAQPHCGPAQTAKHLPLGRGGGVDQGVRDTRAGAGGREGAARARRAGAGQRGPERAPPGPRRELAELVEESRKTWGRCWREKENLREEEEEKPNLTFGVEMGFFFFFFASSKQVK